MTRTERDRVVQQSYDAAQLPGLNPRTRRKRLAGTGVRIDEARRLRWDQVDLNIGRAYIRGTKSDSADRWINLPRWLVPRLSTRAERDGTRDLTGDPPRSGKSPDRPDRRSTGPCGL